MSAERLVPAEAPPKGPIAGSLGTWRCRTAHLLAAIVLAAPTACRAVPPDPVLVRQMAPDGRAAAEVRLTPCESGWCHTLWLGAPDAPALLRTLSVERCDEIAWTPDGARAGFLIDGAQLQLYDARTHGPAGQIDLVEAGDSPGRIARGVTFSENGAAVTFDDCPRDRSGCRPGLVAIR
jgi:hypothetical protein